MDMISLEIPTSCDLGALLSEKLFQQQRCLMRTHTMLHNWVVIKPWITAHVVQTCCCPTFEIGSGIDQCLNSRIDNRTCTHHARFKRDKKCAIIQSPARWACSRAVRIACTALTPSAEEVGFKPTET